MSEEDQLRCANCTDDTDTLYDALCESCWHMNEAAQWHESTPDEGDG